MQPGDTVKLLPPFDAGYVGTFEILRVNDDGTYSVNIPGYENGADFDPIYLEKV